MLSPQIGADRGSIFVPRVCTQSLARLTHRRQMGRAPIQDPGHCVTMEKHHVFQDSGIPARLHLVIKINRTTVGSAGVISSGLKLGHLASFRH